MTHPPYWCRGRLEIKVALPASAREYRLDKPFARIGSLPDSDIVVPGGRNLHRALLLVALQGRVHYHRLGSDTPPESSYGRLAPGQSLRIGEATISASIAESSEAEIASDPPAVSQARADEGDGPCFVKLVVRHEGCELAQRLFTRQLTVVGRKKPSTIRVRHPETSGSHCALVSDGGGVWAIDLVSMRGTRQAGEPIECCRVFEGDSLILGEIELGFAEIRSPGTSEAAETAEAMDATASIAMTSLDEEAIARAERALAETEAGAPPESAAMESQGAAGSIPAQAAMGTRDAPREFEAQESAPPAQPESLEKPHAAGQGEQQHDAALGEELSAEAARLQMERAEHSRRVAELERDRQQLEVQTQDVQRERESFDAQREQIVGELRSLETTLAEERSRIEAAQHQLAQERRELEQRHRLCDDVQADCERIRAEGTDLKRKLNAQSRIVEQQQAELDELRRHREADGQEGTELEDERRKLAQQQSELDELHASLATQQEELHRREAAFAADQTRLRAEFEERRARELAEEKTRQEALDAQTQALASQQTLLGKRDEQLRAGENSLAEKRAELESLSQTIEEQRESLDARREREHAELQKLKDELLADRTNLEALRERLAEEQAGLERMQADLAARQQHFSASLDEQRRKHAEDVETGSRELSAKADVLERESRLLTAERERLTAARQEFEQQRQAQSAEAAELQQARERWQSQQAETVARQSISEAEVRRREEELEVRAGLLEERSGRLESEASELRQQREKHRLEVDRLKQQLSQSRQQLDSASNQLLELQAALEEEKSRCREQFAELQSLEEESLAERQRLQASLAEQREQLEAEFQGQLADVQGRARRSPPDPRDGAELVFALFPTLQPSSRENREERKRLPALQMEEESTWDATDSQITQIESDPTACPIEAAVCREGAEIEPRLLDDAPQIDGSVNEPAIEGAMLGAPQREKGLETVIGRLIDRRRNENRRRMLIWSGGLALGAVLVVSGLFIAWACWPIFTR